MMALPKTETILWYHYQIRRKKYILTSHVPVYTGTSSINTLIILCCKDLDIRWQVSLRFLGEYSDRNIGIRWFLIMSVTWIHPSFTALTSISSSLAPVNDFNIFNNFCISLLVNDEWCWRTYSTLVESVKKNVHSSVFWVIHSLSFLV